MTPDLLEEGAKPRWNARPPRPMPAHATESGLRPAGHSAAYGHARRGRPDPWPHPVPGRRQRELRRFQGHQQAEPGHRARRVALHHRPQRRGQNHHDGHHHRQDAARRRHRCSSASTIDLLRYREAEIAAAGHRPQVPEARRCSSNHTVFENLELALKRDKGVARPHGVRGSPARARTAIGARCCRPSTSPDSADAAWPDLSPRPKAVARDRHAADAGTQAAAARRARGRHDRRRNRPHRRTLHHAQRQTLADGGRARHEFHPHDLRQGHRAVRRRRCWPKARWTRSRPTSASSRCILGRLKKAPSVSRLRTRGMPR